MSLGLAGSVAGPAVIRGARIACPIRARPNRPSQTLLPCALTGAPRARKTLPQESSEIDQSSPRSRRDDKGAPRPGRRWSERRLFIVAIVCVFVAEASIMFVMETAQGVSGAVAWTCSVVDAFVLTLVVGPLLYWLLFRPLVSHIAAHRRAEAELLRLRDELMRRVEDRTARLADANREVHEEIEKRVRATESLRYSENKYSMLVENSLTGIVIFRDGRLTFVNRQFAEMLGYGRDELLRTDVLELIHPEDRDIVAETNRRRLAGEELPAEYEARMLTKTGDIIWVTMRNTLVWHRGKRSTLGNVQDFTTRKRMEQDLSASKEELRRLSTQLLTAQEEERGRMARELHDGVGQSLTAATFGLENAVRKALQEGTDVPVEEAKQLVPRLQRSLEEVQRVSMALRPSILDDFGLMPTIQWFCREFEAAYPGICVEQRVVVHEEVVPEDLKTVTYRVFQEAMNNAAKHSGAKRIVVALRRENETLELRVADDGAGFDPSTVDGTKRPGFGLRSMRERTQLSGGSFSLETRPGAGTRVSARWCLPPPTGRRVPS